LDRLFTAEGIAATRQFVREAKECDLANGHMTIFTRLTRLGPLDGVTTQLWAFTRTVLWSFSQS
jgi:hypothetical protein